MHLRSSLKRSRAGISYMDEFIVRGGEAAKLEPQLLRLSFFLRFREHGQLMQMAFVFGRHHNDVSGARSARIARINKRQ